MNEGRADVQGELKAMSSMLGKLKAGPEHEPPEGYFDDMQAIILSKLSSDVQLTQKPKTITLRHNPWYRRMAAASIFLVVCGGIWWTSNGPLASSTTSDILADVSDEDLYQYMIANVGSIDLDHDLAVFNEELESTWSSDDIEVELYEEYIDDIELDELIQIN